MTIYLKNPEIFLTKRQMLYYNLYKKEKYPKIITSHVSRQIISCSLENLDLEIQITCSITAH